MAIIKFPLKNAHRLLAPRIAYLITTIDQKGRTNVAPISNLTSISTEPEGIALSIYPEWTTFRNIKSNRELVINIPDQRLMEKVWICGDKYAGNPIPIEYNKIIIAELSELPSSKVRPPRLAECFAHLECKVFWIKPLGNHVLVLADVLAASYEEGSFSNETLLNLQSFKPLMQVTGSYFTSPNNFIYPKEREISEKVKSRIKNYSTLKKHYDNNKKK